MASWEESCYNISNKKFYGKQPGYESWEYDNPN